MRREPSQRRDEFLQKLGVEMLDVVEADHHVVAHLEGEVQLLEFLARGGVRRFGGIERSHAMADRRAVDLHEDDAEPAGDVFHERGLAVAGRRDEQQQAHAVGALGVAGGADLLGEIVADERQVGGVDEAIADERGEDLRLEILQPQARAGPLQELALECLKRS